MISYHVDIVDIKGKKTILLLQNRCKILCNMILFHGNLMEFLTSCLWRFCLTYGILAFSDGNSRFDSGSPWLIPVVTSEMNITGTLPLLLLMAKS